MTLPRRFRKHLHETKCIPSRSRVLVGVSGGADSIALLLLLLEVAPEFELTVEAAHLDHALRPVSREDACFVVDFCAERGLSLTTERWDVASLAAQNGANLEETAREVRRDFLAAVARTRNCNRIVLGHHADDQAETFLMNLLRGCGPGGLAGMRETDGLFVRPLLSFGKQELVGYLEAHGHAWREDESNRDLSLTRNRIRHQILPVLRDLRPGLTTRLGLLCARLREDDDCLGKLARNEMRAVVQQGVDDWRIPCEVLTSAPAALAGRLVREVLREVRGDLRGLGERHVRSVLELASSGPVQGELTLPRAWVARRYDVLRLRRSAPPLPSECDFVVDREGDFPLPGGRTLRVLVADRPAGGAVDAVEFCAASLPLPFRLRRPRPGDRIRPSGMSGTRKLQDLFVDLKLTREERRDTLLVEKAGEVLWVVGRRRCEGHRPVVGQPVLRLVVTP